MANDADAGELLDRLFQRFNQLAELSRENDPLAYDKILALANYADYILAAQHPVSVPPSGTTTHTAQVNCPHCKAVVTVALT